MRRRQRRLRAAWLHEQQSIAMALAAGLHSRDVGPVTNAAPRRLTTARAEVRPGILAEPGPQPGVVSAACPHSVALSLCQRWVKTPFTMPRFSSCCGTPWSRRKGRGRKTQTTSFSRSAAASTQCLPTSGCWMASATPSCSTTGHRPVAAPVLLRRHPAVGLL